MSKISAVILAGGKGSRFGLRTNFTPKPLIEIGDMPIIWHIMKLYDHYGINDFIVCAGYLQHQLKRFFIDLAIRNNDLIVDSSSGDYKFIKKGVDNWRVTIVDTGLNTETGGRLKRVKKYVENTDFFCMTYGDSLTNVDVAESIKAHCTSGLLATMSVHEPSGRFGTILVQSNLVKSYTEKPAKSGININAGFYVLSPKVLDLVESDQTVWERDPLQILSTQGQLGAYVHDGFWHPMDTEIDYQKLNDMWVNKNAPWKVWED